jgi:deoxyribodipyrimidine photo-lyase
MTTDLFDSDPFEPTLAAARARLAAVRPGDYARTRNQLDGAVTRLSPYITHGLLTLPEVLSTVRQRHAVDGQHKFVYELGWREFFHHVWHHEGERIFESLHEGPLPEAAYRRELPDDIRGGATGVPVIDQAVRTLYATGWLHNHARMWLASYVVHFRKVHWRAGADWLYGHLLDGDLASNHLSWQWVAGTGSHKPYLFNAENVARYAPQAWHSEGTVVDASYEALDRMARSREPVEGGGPGRPRIDEPRLWHTPPPSVKLRTDDSASRPPPDAWLMHPWALGEPPRGLQAHGLFLSSFHRRWAWSEARWRFVARRMVEAGGVAPVWRTQPLPGGWSGLADAHLASELAAVDTRPVARLFAEPGQRCASFTQYWNRVARKGSA